MSLRVSIITSFDTQHHSTIHNIDPYGYEYVEVYAFMQHCLPILFDMMARRLPGATTNAVKILAAANSLPSEAENVADQINKYYSHSRITALATFIPEIAAHDKHGSSWHGAQKALTFLLKVAGHLKRKHQHPCNTLEMVGGSRLDGVWRGRDSLGEPSFIVNRLPVERAIERLLTRLSPIAAHATEENVNIALELEPGPLFTISDWESLRIFCEMLEAKQGSLGQSVGVNLDVAHWAFLSDITPEMIRTSASVFNRIVHAHVSDHTVGHFGDAAPDTFHGPEEFKPWIELIKELIITPRKMSFSGYVSCELECARTQQAVEEALEVTRAWVSGNYAVRRK